MEVVPFIHNSQVAQLVETNYNLKKLQDITFLLQEKGTFNFPALENGLFSAAIVTASTEYSGYTAVWLRDNVYVAYSHYILGNNDIALKNAKCLMQYFQKHKNRFENIINAQVDPKCVMARPHVRFNGENLAEINQPWEHAQNDALGYFLWFYCKLISDKILEPNQQDVETLALFALYFEAISYWKDEDSGHWEEDRKVKASSIGAVVAGLKALKELNMQLSFISHCCQYKGKLITIELLNTLIQKGLNALEEILPWESKPKRRYDSALLFLIYPLQVINDEKSNEIIADVINNLQGKYGIRRYLGDSFWCHDYEDIPENIRTSIFTEREQWLKENGRVLKDDEEAQWCIFDPIISAIFGMKFQNTRQAKFLEKQVFYLNRSLGQLTATDFKLGGFKCPELYYLKGENYIPNDATPLLWTQANLRIALELMKQSLVLGNF